MAIKKYKPTSPGRRFMTYMEREEITKSEPEKSLLEPLPKKGGRNNYGRVTARHRGGGHKRRYRRIDFKRDKFEVPAKVAAIEYDPNRSANIALLHYLDGEKRYILAPKGLTVGAQVISTDKADIMPGNAMPLANIPLGTHLHNVELKIGAGGQIVRSAGTYAQLMAKEGRLRHPEAAFGRDAAGHLNCRATIGEVGNEQHENVQLGQSGPHPLVGQAAQGPRRGHEPGGSPHGRRRGPQQRWSSSLQPLGLALQGLPHPQEEAFGQLHRPPALSVVGASHVA